MRPRARPLSDGAGADRRPERSSAARASPAARATGADPRPPSTTRARACPAAPSSPPRSGSLRYAGAVILSTSAALALEGSLAVRGRRDLGLLAFAAVVLFLNQIAFVY